MGTRTKAALTTLAATLLLALGAVGAQANSLEFSHEMFEITWDELVFEAGGLAVICPVQLLGELHDRQIQKEEELIGIINHARVFTEECEGGRALVHAETLPWHLTFEGWAGSLPNIEDLFFLIVGAGFLIEPAPFEVYCEAFAGAGNPMEGFASISEGTVTSFTAGESSIPITGPFPCNLVGEGTIEGRADFTNLSGDQPITVVLI